MVSFKTTLAEEVLALLEGGADIHTLSKQWHFPKSVETLLNAQFDASQCIWAQAMVCLLALVVYRVMRQRLNGAEATFRLKSAVAAQSDSAAQGADQQRAALVGISNINDLQAIGHGFATFLFLQTK